MKTARQRYEASTKVVTFRVPIEIYDQIEETKAQTGLSNTDLIKLGAGIAQEEVKSKLAQASDLESRLAQIKAAVQQAEQELANAIAAERKRRLGELDIEMEAFRLFDCQWSLEEVSFKLGIDRDTAYRHFRSWGETRGKKEALERELLRACLKECIKGDELECLSYGLFFNPPAERTEALRKEIDYCYYLLTAPDRMPPHWRELLLTKYANRILADRSEKSPADEPTEVEQAEHYLRQGYSLSHLRELGFKPLTVRQAMGRLRNLRER